MGEKDTITMLFVEEPVEPAPGKQMFPTFKSLQTKIVEVSKDVLARSLGELVLDLSELLEDLTVSQGNTTLDEVSLSVQFTTDGGVQWIASASAGLSNSMTLTFKVKSPETQ